MKYKTLVEEFIDRYEDIIRVNQMYYYFLIEKGLTGEFNRFLQQKTKGPKKSVFDLNEGNKNGSNA